MFANMQKIVIVLLVVGFVPARVSAKSPSDKIVLEMYGATDRHLIGSFNLTVSEVTQTRVVLKVHKPLNFTSKYPYVAMLLYSNTNVMPGCRTTGPPIKFLDGKPVVLYSGLDKDIVNKADYTIAFKTSMNFMVSYDGLSNIAVMFSMNAEDPKPSPIACGKIRHATSPDFFLTSWNNHVNVHESTTRPLSGHPINAPSMSAIEAVTDLYSATTGAFAGSMVYQTWTLDYLTTAVLPSGLQWGNKAAIAVVYLAKQVMPGCVTAGPAVARIHGGTNDSYPVVLFNASIADIRTPIYATLTGFASVSSASEFNLIDHVVVVYSLESTDSGVLNDFLQPTNGHTPFACGSIRYADAAKDNFLEWAPVGSKPIRTSGMVKWWSVMLSLAGKCSPSKKTP